LYIVIEAWSLDEVKELQEALTALRKKRQEEAKEA